MSRVFQSAFGQAGRAMGSFDKANQRVNDVLNSTGTIATTVGAGILAPLGLALNEAVKFEDSLSGVAKQLSLRQGSQGLKVVGQQIQDTAAYLASTPEDAAKLYAELAAGGAAKKELNTMARLAGRMGVAFDITAGQAGENFIKVRNVLNSTTKSTEQLMNAVNFLADNTAAKGDQLVTFFTSGGGAASRALKISAENAAAIGATYISMGKSGEEAATIVERLTKTLRNQDKAAGKIFAAKGGGIAGVIAALQQGGKLKGAARFEFFKAFGEYGIEVENLATNLTELNKNLGMVADTGKFSGSVLNEFQNRSQTAAFRIAQAKTNLQNFAIEAGTGLIPVLTDLLKMVTPVIRSMTTWARENPKLTATIAKGALVVGTLITGLGLVAKVMAVVNAVMYANPIGLVIAGVAALAAGAYLVYKNWGGITKWFGNLWNGVVQKFWSAVTMIKSIGKIMYEAGKNIFTSIWQGLKATFMLPIVLVQKLVQKIRNMLPFSPAKEGPLKTLHRVKIAETIAGAINPAPVADKMRTLVNPIANPLPFSGLSSGGGGQMSVNYSPQITIQGNADQAVIRGALKDSQTDLETMLKKIQAEKMRRSFEF